MLKKLFVGTALTLAVSSAGLFTATDADAAEKKVDMKEVNVQFVPSAQADKMEAKTKPLEKLLSKQLGVPVHVSVSTDYNTVVEAMGSKKVDMGFLPPDPYVHAHKKYGVEPLLQSERYDINDKKGDGSNKKNLTKTYRAMVLVKKDSKIKNVKDLKNKSIAVQNTTSDAGYIFPIVDLNKDGMNVVKNSNLVTVKGHDQGVMSVLNGDTDAAFVFDDARNLVKNDNKNVFKKTRVLKYTTEIPNDTISIRKGVSKHDQKAIKKAMKHVANDDKQGKKIMKDVYTWEGVTDTKDSNFDKVRDYQKKLEDIK
ncbi:phosphonate transport system substrate-binding protein [Weissella uvarum]|uniref:phosphate/phosphite/phosphonate ABC transporter substrate-binding protein n=1 Tax=Weissella uvarum TaxID=1479233 RepID=UPI00196135D2|nr:phosphate/phosphite/phosphonate ABC transporter substrate-binding protein [Weissella uvarum]MBM7618036.1 phosphonate transport system substrate-binding protein [Weissella uvarum]MCM0595107.1 phosphate/phosphite/phosphonate ABC transporter substrate-binding protein [Weissella uvarum]